MGRLLSKRYGAVPNSFHKGYPRENNMSKTTTIILVILGCLLLAVANLALWATLDIFNAERFGENVAAGLQSPEATEALAEPIVDRLMATYPDLPAIARGPAIEVVTWTLQRPLFTPIFEGVAAGALTIMTTSAQDIVGIDIGEVATNAGANVTGVIAAVSPEAAENAQAALEDAIATSEESGPLAIYEQGRFPKLRQISNITPWLALLAVLGAIGLYAWAYVRAQDQHRALMYIGAGIMLSAVLGFLLLAPLVQGVAQNNIANPTMQIVVGSVISVLVRGFFIQSLLLFTIGGIVLVINHVRGGQDEPAPAGASPSQPASDQSSTDEAGNS